MKNRPFAICHVMMSLDGRIGSSMTEAIGDSDAYKSSLASIQCQTTLMGVERLPSKYKDEAPFSITSGTPIGREFVNVACRADDYSIIIDTLGGLNVELVEQREAAPLIVVMSEDAPVEYADWLTRQGVNWIAVGRGDVDYERMADIISTKFGVERMVVFGGGKVNGAMLAAGLLDEVSVIVGAGIDGRRETSVFDGIADEGWDLTRLRLQGVARVGSAAVWLRYDVLSK